ncbi:MAG: hypothetical protein HUU38_05960 [Anaerolineales bacterium]|nr:hypothetical protein [Anaerolineales bacterium]
MLPREIIPFVCEHFVWGKILREGKDVSGYKIVAKTPGLTEKDCADVLGRTGSGFSQAILRGRRAYAFFQLSPKQIVFSCTQRSLTPENLNRYYLQTHFLVFDQEVFEAIHADLQYLAKEMDEIPTFEEEKTLPLFKATYQRQNSIESDLRRIARLYPSEFLENTYRALKGDNPVAIFDSSGSENKVLDLFQLLFLLTPPTERKHLTFASMASGAEVGKYKFKVNPTGVLKLPHIVIRLDDAKVVPPHLVAQLPSFGILRFHATLVELMGEKIRE